MVRLTKFFTRQTTAPLTGPRLKAARRAGSSEKSILTKVGMRKGIGKSRAIRIVATAESMAVTAILWVLLVEGDALGSVDIKTGSFTEISKDNPSSEYCRKGAQKHAASEHLLPSRL